MNSQNLFLIILVAAVAVYFVGYKLALRAVRGIRKDLYSMPGYHGLYLSTVSFVPALIIFAIISFSNDYLISAKVAGMIPEALKKQEAATAGFDVMKRVKQSTVVGDDQKIDKQYAPLVQEYISLKGAASIALYFAVLSAFIAGAAYGISRIEVEFTARQHFETLARLALFMASLLSVLFTLAIIISVLYESLKFFKLVPVWEFLFGMDWSPQRAGESGAFGSVPLFAGTFMITMIAMIVAVPLGVFSAVYMSEYASNTVRSFSKPVLELLAGIPTVVYGYFAIVFLAPQLKNLGDMLGVSIATESAMVAGVVMGVMIIPFISSLSDDVINSVPQSLRDASLAVGATKSETIKQVILPAALPGIMGAVLLGVSRAIGETMIVVMAAGMAANLTANPFESVTTVTVQIVKLLVGDQEFDSPKTLAAFALGLVLFVVTLVLNYVAIGIVKKYREAYE